MPRKLRCLTGEAVIIVADPEGFKAISDATFLTPGVAIGIARFVIAAVGEERPIAIRPDVEGASLIGFREMAGLRINPRRAPDQTGGRGALWRDGIGEELIAYSCIASATDGQA